MKLPELPGLPQDGKVTIGISGGVGTGVPVRNAFTADQMRSYALQCMEMMREECAATCDAVSRNYTRHYKLGAEQCAAAIREKTP